MTHDEEIIAHIENLIELTGWGVGFTRREGGGIIGFVLGNTTFMNALRATEGIFMQDIDEEIIH